MPEKKCHNIEKTISLCYDIGIKRYFDPIIPMNCYTLCALAISKTYSISGGKSMLTETQLLQTVLSNYENISDMLKQTSQEEFIYTVANLLKFDPLKLEQFPMGGYSKGKTSGAYQYVIEDLLRNTDKYDWVYQHLEDSISREVFTNLIRYRIIPDMEFIKAAYDNKNPQYFDKNIITCDENEVFVDCGGFIGDTVLKYIECFHDYKKMYVYEPSSDNYDKCKENLSTHSNILVRNAGVGEFFDNIPMDVSGSSSSFLSATNDSYRTDIVSLDEDILEPVTFIKMDIEGYEIPAILGAKKHIKNDFPKLAICTYHIISDIWEIPMLLHMIRPDYKYYLRHYQEDQNWETVLYAIPNKKPKHKGKKIHRVVAMAPYERPWSNVELVKNCGLIPYLLYKNHGCDVSMVGAKGGDYPYAELVKGMKLEFLEDGKIMTKLQYIIEHGKAIDCLILRGCYPSNFGVAIAYKTVNPEGKIYVGLDANSHWMDRILWDDKDFMEFMDCCDVIATSCTAMQKHLNEKWPWHIECIPNGYYNVFSEKTEERDFSKKESIILTVGRLGTRQKATEVLLEAFATIANQIPDWKLHLVGSIEDTFWDYIVDYYKRYPSLTQRVIFTGPILDREVLKKEYQNAKIFALPSTLEGGTPNVVSEALWAGCVLAVTKFDAYEDAIGNGRCGKSAPTNDINTFSQILLELCTSDNLEQMFENAKKHGRTFFDMEKIVGGLYEQLCL